MTLDESREFYAQLGFATIPLRPRSKRPLRKGWQDASPEQWRDITPDVNIGIVTGAPSRDLIVLDFDTRDGPMLVLGMTPEQLAIITMVVETSRGWHVYARAAGIASSTRQEGLDVRGNAGMIVAPPSIHPSGHQYRFVGSARTVVPLDAIAPLLLAKEPASAPDLDDVEGWIRLQAPRLQDAWTRLRNPPSSSFDASKADFAVACCLAEAGYTPEDVSAVLLRLPGSRAIERGEAYALLTAHRARRARLGVR